MAYPYGGPEPGRQRTAGGAIASLVLGVLALVGICGAFVPAYLRPDDAPVLILLVAGFFVVLGAAAVFAGVGARRQIGAGLATGNGLAITGMVLGVVAMVVILLLQVLLMVLHILF